MWKTKDGSNIRICDMGDRHLLNAMRMLAQQAEIKRAVSVHRFLQCPQPSGDMAQDCYQREFDELLDAEWLDFVPDIYRSLVAEADRRQLDYEDYIEPESALSLEFR